MLISIPHKILIGSCKLLFNLHESLYYIMSIYYNAWCHLTILLKIFSTGVNPKMLLFVNKV